MCNCRKTFDGKLNKKKQNKLMSCLPIFSKAPILGSEVEVTSCSKDKGKKRILDGAFMIDYISAYKSQIALKGVDFVADTPRINAKLRVMMAAFADAFQNRCS